MAIHPRGQRQTADEGCDSAACASMRDETVPAHVHHREDRGVREQGDQQVEHLLAAPHSGEPVVHQGDAGLVQG